MHAVLTFSEVTRLPSAVDHIAYTIHAASAVSAMIRTMFIVALDRALAAAILSLLIWFLLY
jgi:hypothetical protein